MKKSSEQNIDNKNIANQEKDSLTGKRRTGISPLLLIFLTVFVDLVGFGIIIPLNPYLARHFGASPLMVGLLMSVYSAAQFIFAPFWGNLSDRIGRRPVILVSLLGASLSHLLFAFGSHLWVLFLARGLAGVFGGNISAAMAYIADITEGKDRSKGMGLIGAAFGLGFVLGPFLGGIAADLGSKWGTLPPFGASLAAVLASFICFVNFFSAVFFLHETLPEKLRGLAKKRPSRFQLIFKYLRPTPLGFAIFINFLMVFSMAHMEVSLFMYVQDKFSWSLSQASFGFAYAGIIMAFTQGYLIRKFIPRWGERKVLIMGLASLSLGLIGIGFSPNIFFLAISVTLIGLSGLATASINGSVSLLADSSEQGVVMGVNQSLSSLARILGPASGGWFYGHVMMSSPFWVGGLLTALGIFIVLKIYAQFPDSREMA